MESIVYKPGGKKMKQRILSNLKEAGNREEKKKDKSIVNKKHKRTEINSDIHIPNKYKWVRLIY